MTPKWSLVLIIGKNILHKVRLYGLEFFLQFSPTCWFEVGLHLNLNTFAYSTRAINHRSCLVATPLRF